jgi:hypothetical protein
MNRPNTRNSMRRWRAVGNAALALSAITVIGFTSIAPARADADGWRWRHRGDGHEREWREHREHGRPGVGFYVPTYSYSYPSYGYYTYPSYGYDYDGSR